VIAASARLIFSSYDVSPLYPPVKEYVGFAQLIQVQAGFFGKNVKVKAR
jgi:hypothetical protein